MRSRIGAAAVAGLIAGLLCAMSLVGAKTPDGMSAISVYGNLIGSPTIAAGFIVNVIDAAIIGALFGWLLGMRANTMARALVWGLIYGFVWWIIGGLIVVPMIMGLPAFAPLTQSSLHAMAWGGLFGHLVFGLILGAAFRWSTSRHQCNLCAISGSEQEWLDKRI